MNELESKRWKNLLRIILFLVFFLLEFYLYVFVRNDNILDLFVTILAGIFFIISLIIYFKDCNGKNTDKKNITNRST